VTHESFTALVSNAALLLSLVYIYDQLSLFRWGVSGTRIRQAVAGIAVGAIGIFIMQMPWTFATGVTFDTRSVLLAISGLFFGPLPTVVAVLMTATFRLIQGGVGAWTGVAVIVASSSIGVAWRLARERRLTDLSFWTVYSLGLVVHLVMLALMFTLPLQTALKILSSIALPVLIIYPIATAACGMLMIDRQQRDLAVRTIRESESQFRALFEQAALGVAKIDVRIGRLVLINQRLADLLGYAREELLALDLQTITHPDDRAATSQNLQELVSGHVSSFTMAKRCVRKDGDVIWVNLTASRLWREGDEPDFAMATIEDISEHKRMETSLQEARGMAERYLSVAAEVILGLDAQGNITLLNDSGHRLLGYAPGELIGKNWFDTCLPEEMRTEVHGVFAKLMGGEYADVVTYGNSIITRSGNRLELLWHNTLLRDSDGRIVGALSSGQDITERKQVEEQLRETSDYLNKLLDYANAPVVVWDSAYRISLFNHAFERLTGRSSSSVLGKEVELLFAPNKLEGSMRNIHRVSSGERWETVEIDIQHVDGTVRTLLWNSASLYAPDGTMVLATIAQGQDITERKQAEEEIRALNADLDLRVHQRTAELIAANKELEAFGYSVSHDLRSPLRAIDGFSQALLEDYGALIPPEGHEDLERVRRASQRMGQLIDGMLVLSRVTRSQIHVQQTDMSALAADVAGELARDNPQQDVHVSIDPGMTATGDPQLLRIVLVNLLGNAWKFTSKQEHAHVMFGSTRDVEHGLVFFVRDDGAGFDPKYKDKLFVPFQRLHSLEEFPGTGIGLATVERAVRRHGGGVWAEGEVDRGATFYFTIPDLYTSIPTKGEQL